MVVVGCAVAAAVLAFVIYDHVVIMASVVLGSYSIIRGVACYAGGYINEFTMAEMIKDGLYADINPEYWAYIGGFVVLVGVGAIWQYRQRKRDMLREQEEKHPHKTGHY